MPLPQILVTGAAGKTGSAVVAQLRERGYPVRAVVTRHDERSARLVRLGAQTVVANLFDTDQTADAMRGVTRAYYVPFAHPHMVHSATAFAVAARDAGLESVVQMSQWLSSPSHPALFTRQTWIVDNIFASTLGAAHTIVNPGWFADNLLRVVDFATLLGVYPVLTGKSRSAPVSNEDIARVVVAVLTDPLPHAGKRYRPTGPKLLSAYEAAAVIEKVIGRTVRPVELPFWMFLKVARQQRVNPFEIDGFRYYLEDHKQGAFEFEGGVNDVVRELTGRPAEDFETTVRRYAALPFAQRTLANRLRAIANFLSTPLLPGYDLDRLARQQQLPAAVAPRFALEDPGWRAQHSTA